MGSGQSVGGVTFDHVHGNATGAAVVQPSFRKKNTMPTELDISSMLEAAKQHINRAKESKKVCIYVNIQPYFCLYFYGNLLRPFC